MKAKAVCGARTKSGGTCQRRPLKGRTRCALHGGKSRQGPEHGRFKTGRYASTFLAKLQLRYDTMESEENPLDLLPELSAMRALLATYLERLGDGSSMSAEQVGNAMAWLSEVAKTVERVERIRQATSLTTLELKFLQTALSAAIEEFIPDARARGDFLARVRDLLPQPRATDQAREVP